MDHTPFGLGILRIGFEFGLPARIDLDLLLHVLLLVAIEPLLLAVEDQLVGVIWMKRAHDGEEVLPAALATFGILIWKVDGHPRQLYALIVELGHRYLFVLGRVADLDRRRLHQLLLVREDLLQVLGRHLVVRRHVVLAAE